MSTVRLRKPRWSDIVLSRGAEARQRVCFLREFIQSTGPALLEFARWEFLQVVVLDDSWDFKVRKQSF